jgi:hypothetical protein
MACDAEDLEQYSPIASIVAAHLLHLAPSCAVTAGLVYMARRQVVCYHSQRSIVCCSIKAAVSRRRLDITAAIINLFDEEFDTRSATHGYTI